MRTRLLLPVLIAMNAPTATAHVRTAEDAAVYTAVLDATFAGHNAERLIVASTTRKGINRTDLVPGYWSSLSKVEGVDSTTLRDFETVNLEAASVPALPAAKIPVVLVDDSVFANIQRLPLEGDTARLFGSADRYWHKFYRRFPGSPGSTRFSRIGYSADGTQALVQMDHGCGSLCGAGEFILVAKQDGVWQIANRVLLWVS